MESFSDIICIPPEFQDLYSRKESCEGSKYQIVFDVPKGKDLFAFKININESRSSITVKYGELPISVLEGKTVSPIANIDETYLEEQNQFMLDIVLSEDGQGKPLIANIHEETGELDPMAALNVFIISFSQGDNAIANQAAQWLIASAAVGFIPSILLAAKIIDNYDLRTQLLQIGVEKYKNANCMFEMALMHIKDGKADDIAIKYLKMSAELDSNASKAILGLIYSPHCHRFPGNTEKDPALSAKYFHEIIESEEDGIILHELAKLYYTGTGVGLNKEKALELQKRAKAALREDQEIEELDDLFGPSTGQSILIGAGVALAGVALAYGIYKIFRKK